MRSKPPKIDMKPHFTHLWEIARGIGGTAAPVLGIIASWQEHLEWSLRILSLILGISVAILTLISFARPKKPDK